MTFEEFQATAYHTKNAQRDCAVAYGVGFDVPINAILYDRRRLVIEQHWGVDLYSTYIDGVEKVFYSLEDAEFELWLSQQENTEQRWSKREKVI